MRKTTTLILTATLALALAACEDTRSDAQREDRELSENILTEMQDAHPVPQFDRSQERQNLVELITARAQSTDTTTFFFNMGIPEPVNQCPSIGFPIPATMQVTNPQVGEYYHSGGTTVVPQVEPTGVYTGETTGTYALCLDAQGNGYAVYWEGFVQTVTGPAEFKDGQVQLIGPPSFDFTTDVGDVDVTDAPAEGESEQDES